MENLLYWASLLIQVDLWLLLWRWFYRNFESVKYRLNLSIWLTGGLMMTYIYCVARLTVSSDNNLVFQVFYAPLWPLIFPVIYGLAINAVYSLVLLFKGLKKKYEKEAGDLYITDIVCSAMAKECSKEIIDAARKHFLPGYQPLNLDYACKPDAPNEPFPSEDEMIRFFTDNQGYDQFFYWNQQQDNPDKVMFGAHIAGDHHLIISLTFNGTSATRAKYYHALKTFLNADAVAISYSTPAKYDDGADFIRRYQNQRQDFEQD